MKIGVMFGSPETTTGGNALKFYATMRLDIRRIGSIKKGDEVVGNETRVKVVKNKVSPPFREAIFDIMYGTGISREGEIIDMGVEADIVEKSGSWYSYNTERIGQGKDNAREFLKENPEIAKEISQAVGFATANKAAKALLPKEILNNPTIYPPKDIQDQGEFQEDVGEAIVIYEKYWEMLKLNN